MNKSDFDLEIQSEQLESRIVASLERISQAFRVLLWNQGKELLLSPIQIQVLIFLLNHSAEKRKVSYLANEFNMTKATISDTIKALDAKGYISKEQEDADTRSYIINLTKSGKIIAKKTASFTSEFHEPINKLSKNEMETLYNSLAKIISQLNKSGIITIQRMCFTCAYYQTIKSGDKHYCSLLNQALKNTEIRIDCAEHEFA